MLGESAGNSIDHRAAFHRGREFHHRGACPQMVAGLSPLLLGPSGLKCPEEPLAVDLSAEEVTGVLSMNGPPFCIGNARLPPEVGVDRVAPLLSAAHLLGKAGFHTPKSASRRCAPPGPASSRAAPRRQPDRSGKCRQSEFPTTRAPATRWVDGPTKPERLPFCLPILALAEMALVSRPVWAEPLVSAQFARNRTSVMRTDLSAWIT